MKKIICFLVALSIMQSIVYAEALRYDERGNESKSTGASNIVFYDDYTSSSVGQAPAGYSISGGESGTVTVEEFEVTTAGGKKIKKNCLVADDNVPDSTGSKKFAGVSFVKNFPEIKGKFALEVRFLFVEESNPAPCFQIMARSGKSNIIRILDGSSTGFLGTLSSVGDIANIGAIKPDVWYTIRFIVDMNTDMMQMRVTAKEIGLDAIYTELGLVDENAKSLESADNIYFDTQVYDGKIVFDYISIEKKPVEYNTADIGFTHPSELIIPGFTDIPQNAPVEERVNLRINEEYVYPASPMYIKNGRTMIYIKNYSKIFGVDMKNENTLILKDGEAVFAGGAMSLNGEARELSANCETIDGKLYIPIKDAALSDGCTVGWEGETKTVIITR